MARTAQLKLPMLQPAQAQKHVTVNEALARIDALVQLRVASSEVLLPPPSVGDGEVFIVPAGAQGAWQERSGDLAVWSNGGWEFIRPRHGWRAWNEERWTWAVFDGHDWIHSAGAVSPGGAATLQTVLEFDHDVVAGAENVTPAVIPAGAQVIGITGRVVETITGSLTTWRLGVPGSDNRYGAGLGLIRNSYALGLTGSPLTYYSDTHLLLTPEGGEFSGGVVRLAIHAFSLQPPRPF